jgi:hypothetical protein
MKTTSGRGSGAKVAWKPGMHMELMNSNGAVDPSTLGYEYTIQTTTQIRAEVVEQVFYEVPLADFVPMLVGTGAWMENIKTNLVYQAGGDFAAAFRTCPASRRSPTSRWVCRPSTPRS